MRIRDIVRSGPEKSMDGQLIDALQPQGYRVHPSVRLCDVLDREVGELDSREDHDFRTMHFDFVITKAYSPVFVAEFDGPQHQEDSTRARLDAVKNKFCRDGGLPMLRMSSQELAPHERVSVLQWVLARWLAWLKESPQIWREVIEEIQAGGLRPEDFTMGEIGGYAVMDPSFDPNVRFDLRHPYPAILTVAHRLHRLGIITDRADSRMIARLTSTIPPHRLTRCGTRVSSVGVGGDGEEEWQVSERSGGVARWEGPDPRLESVEPLYVTTQRVKTRWALPVGWGAREALSLPDSGPFDPDAIARRIEHLWACDLPGASSSDIADGLGEYLVLRDIEEWARRNWQPASFEAV